MAFRHEWKHMLNKGEMQAVRSRLGAVMCPDPHAGPSGQYMVRSLYFDTPGCRALREKLDGLDRREKFRIRLYNGDTDLLRLEKKSKVHGLCSKESAVLAPAEAQAILEGELGWMPGARDRPLVQELYVKMRTQGLRPRTIVDYTREPFLYGPGNVRVTLDYDIRTGLRSIGFLNPSCVTIPVRGGLAVLEVKWDAYLPEVVKDVVQLGSRQASAFSKYAACTPLT